MKERVDLFLPPIDIEQVEVEIGEPAGELLGSIKEFSQSKRWFRDTTRIPDIG